MNYKNLVGKEGLRKNHRSFGRKITRPKQISDKTGIAKLTLQ